MLAASCSHTRALSPQIFQWPASAPFSRACARGCPVNWPPAVHSRDRVLLVLHLSQSTEPRAALKPRLVLAGGDAQDDTGPQTVAFAKLLHHVSGALFCSSTRFDALFSAVSLFRCFGWLFRNAAALPHAALDSPLPFLEQRPLAPARSCPRSSGWRPSRLSLCPPHCSCHCRFRQQHYVGE